MENITSADVKNKKVIVRVDYNVPIKDGKILDETRIIASLETINYLIKNEAKVILLSHLGRIKSEEDKNTNSLSIVAKRLSKLVNVPVYFVGATRGHIVEETVDNLLTGEIVLIENTRFEDFPKKLESSCDEALSKYWARLGDIFVLEAFGSAHRCHASTYGISKYLPSYAGFLVEKETNMLNEALKSSRTLIMGGAKVEDKIGVIDNLITTSDCLLLGGAMCFTFLKAKGIDVGSSIVSEDHIDYAKGILEEYQNKIVLPIDVVTQNGVKDIKSIGTTTDGKYIIGYEYENDKSSEHPDFATMGGILKPDNFNVNNSGIYYVVYNNNNEVIDTIYEEQKEELISKYSLENNYKYTLYNFDENMQSKSFIGIDSRGYATYFEGSYLNGKISFYDTTTMDLISSFETNERPLSLILTNNGNIILGNKILVILGTLINP